ncbi:uncharacterized protein LOC143027042 [Oratosquilla oratoria]|uniref:uncharacterized protein LOC143027042 n=1 Tax=Oratosquilla oratoria TaxID=337810 RepID=UPI003F76F48E
MDSRFLILLPLVLWTEQVHGSRERNVTASCCNYYKQMMWDEYGKCVDSYGIVPICDGSKQGCYYGNRFYTEGETVATIPSKCIKLICSEVNVHSGSDGNFNFGNGGQLVVDNARTVQMKIVHVSSGCGCCEDKGELFPNQTARILDRSICDISICIDGQWVSDYDDYDYSTSYYYYSYDYRADGLDKAEEARNEGVNFEFVNNIKGSQHDCEHGIQKCIDACNKGTNSLDGAKQLKEKCLHEFKNCSEKHQRNKIDHDDDKDIIDGSGRRRFLGDYYGGHKKCCSHEGQYYIHEETISISSDSYGTNCRRRFCYYGYIRTRYSSCCCIENNEMYSCYEHRPLPSSDHETCSIRKCCDGIIETYHQPGCCYMNGQIYKPGQKLGYSKDYCQIQRCVDSEIIYEDAGYCCKVDGKYYRPYSVVESNPKKCILKKCHWREGVINYSLDTCHCCLYNDQLYVNGSTLSPSPCVTIQCIDGKWNDGCSRIKCDYCHIGTFYKTFDGVVFNYDGYCNSTLVQSYNYHYSRSRTIHLSFKKCSLPFSDSLACNDVLTIKHSHNTAITIRPGGYIEINGNPVTDLSYSGHYNLFIYETAFAIRVITFSGVIVEYGKDINPDVRIYTPSYNKWNHYGLCGTYDGKKKYDLVPRHHYYYNYDSSLSYFFNSWRASYSCSNENQYHGRNCSSLTATEVEHITTMCWNLYDSIECHQARLNLTAYREACVRYMCACLPCQQSYCKMYMESEYINDCSTHGGHVVFDCDDDHEHSSTMETPWVLASTTYNQWMFSKGTTRNWASSDGTTKSPATSEETTESSVPSGGTTESPASSEETTESSVPSGGTTESSASSEETTESSVSGEETAESLVFSEETTESSVSSRGTTESPATSEETTKSSVPSGGTTESPASSEETTESSVPSGGTTESSASSEETTESSVSGEETAESLVFSEETTESSVSSRGTTESPATSEETTESSVPSGGTTESPASSEETTESSVPSGGTTESSASSEETTESSVSGEETAESLVFSEETTESSVSSRGTTESPATSEETTESSVPSGGTTESSASSEETTESSASSEETTESSASSEETTESSASSEETTESSASSEETTESSVPSGGTTESSASSEETTESSVSLQYPVEEQRNLQRPVSSEETAESLVFSEETTESSVSSRGTTESPASSEETTKSLVFSEERTESSVLIGEITESPASSEETTESLVFSEETTESSV